jgi:hypothetical protein
LLLEKGKKSRNFLVQMLRKKIGREQTITSFFRVGAEIQLKRFNERTQLVEIISKFYLLQLPKHPQNHHFLLLIEMKAE